MNPLGTSPSPNQTQVPEKKEGQKMEGGNEMNTTQPTVALQAADAWNTADAPDKFFAIVPDEAKGPNGKKSLRKIPLASVQKKDLDEAIIRDALSRLPQTDLPAGFTKDEVLGKICAAAGSLKLDLPSCKKQGAMVGGKEETKLNESTPCEQAQAALKVEVESMKTKMAALESENKELNAYKAEVVKKERAATINGLVELKAKCGLIEEKDRAQAASEMEKLSADALNALGVELKAVQAKFESMPRGLKAKFEGNQNAARELRRASQRSNVRLPPRRQRGGSEVTCHQQATLT